MGKWKIVWFLTISVLIICVCVVVAKKTTMDEWRRTELAKIKMGDYPFVVPRLDSVIVFGADSIRAYGNQAVKITFYGDNGYKQKIFPLIQLFKEE